MVRITSGLVALVGCIAVAQADAPRFTSLQPELFSSPHALSNAFADFDGDGDLDLAVSFENGAVRLYRNDRSTFVEVGARLGLPASGAQIRALAWGDFDGDGDPDLHGGVSSAEGDPSRNRLFRNDGGKAFVGMADKVRLVLTAADSRQSSWIDYDNDGDLDLFSAQRFGPNRMFRNDGGQFTDVSLQLGLADPRRTVGSCWFDMDQDGDLDVFQANQDSDEDALFRNEGDIFIDVAPRMGMNHPGRTATEGGVGCSVADYDNDGLLDLLVATYGPTWLYRNLGGGKFREVAAEVGLYQKRHAVGASWGDADNDGFVDLYLAAYVVDGENWYSRSHLFMNRRGKLVDALGDDNPMRLADHGVQWADIDRDGDLDLSVTDDYPDDGRHPVFRNDLPKAQARRSLQVMVLDRKGHATRSGSEVRLFSSSGKLLGTSLVATGDGYGSQSVVPVHFGLANAGAVTVEVTFLTRSGRKVKRLERVDPRKWIGKSLVVRADD